MSENYAKLEWAKQTCAQCGLQEAKKKCCHVFYCNKDCQRQHWPAHKINCDNGGSKHQISEKVSRLADPKYNDAFSGSSEYLRYCWVATASKESGRYQAAEQAFLMASNCSQVEYEKVMARLRAAVMRGKQYRFVDAISILVEIKRTVNHETYSADFELTLAELYSCMRQTDQVLKYCNQAWPKCSDARDKLLILRLMCDVLIFGNEALAFKRLLHADIVTKMTDAGLFDIELSMDIMLGQSTFDALEETHLLELQTYFSLADAKKQHANPALGMICKKLALVESQLGRYKSSRKHARMAIELSASSGDLVGVAEAWDIQGKVAALLGDSAAAATCRKNSVESMNTARSKWSQPKDDKVGPATSSLSSG